MAVTPTVPVLFLGGLGRSGSTLLELILAQSDDVCALGEVVHLWERGLRLDERCGCGARFSGCPFWAKVGERAFGGWPSVDLDGVAELKARVDRTRHLPRLARSRLPERHLAAVRQYAAFYTRVYRAAVEVSGASVVVDSSKHASLAFALRWAEGLDLRVVHLVRDSRAVAHSWARRVRRPEVVDAEAYMPTFSPVQVSALWTVQNLAFDTLATRHGAAGSHAGQQAPARPPVVRIRYEDFTADPWGTVAAVRRLAGLAYDPAALRVLDEPLVRPRPAHTVAGNPLRFASGPLRVRADEEWRTAFPARTRALVGALTLPLRLRYGYRSSSRPAAPADLKERA